MKKILAIGLGTMMIVSLAGCSKDLPVMPSETTVSSSSVSEVVEETTTGFTGVWEDTENGFLFVVNEDGSMGMIDGSSEQPNYFTWAESFSYLSGQEAMDKLGFDKDEILALVNSTPSVAQLDAQLTAAEETMVDAVESASTAESAPANSEVVTDSKTKSDTEGKLQEPVAIGETEAVTDFKEVYAINMDVSKAYVLGVDMTGALDGNNEALIMFVQLTDDTAVVINLEDGVLYHLTLVPGKVVEEPVMPEDAMTPEEFTEAMTSGITEGIASAITDESSVSGSSSIAG